ncbi:MAG: putative Ig domain-containing protein [Parasphingorhabdus sp.]
MTKAIKDILINSLAISEGRGLLEKIGGTIQISRIDSHVLGRAPQDIIGFGEATYRGWKSLGPEFEPIDIQYSQNFAFEIAFGLQKAATEIERVSGLTFSFVDPNIVSDLNYFINSFGNVDGETPLGNKLPVGQVVSHEDFDTAETGFSQIGFNSQAFLNFAFETGTAVTSVINSIALHELLHPFGFVDNTAGLIAAGLNSSEFTVISRNAGYFSPNPRQSLSIGDIWALQQVVGVNHETYDGDTTYNLHVLADNDSQTDQYSTIWDAGGTDSLNASSLSEGVTLDLRQGTTSSLKIDGYDLGIAYGTVIENADGSNYDDVVIGNLAKNRVDAGDGDDYIFGSAQALREFQAAPGEYLGLSRFFDPEYYTVLDIESSDEDWTYAEVEGEEFNGAAPDSITDHDTLSGGAGDDVIFGGDGDDKITGGAGDNILVAGMGTDTLDYSDPELAADASVEITLGQKVSGGIFTEDVFVDFVETDGSDGSGNDEIYQFERITTGAGNDSLFVQSWEQTINDWEYIDLGTASNPDPSNPESDLVVAGSGLENSVTIDLRIADEQYIKDNNSANLFSLRHVESAVGTKYDDTLYAVNKGTQQFGGNLIGGDGDDIIWGSVSANTLIGGKGDDEIHLGARDFAIGGKGADKFYVTTTLEDGIAAEANRVFILDFNAEEGDTLYVDGVLFNGYQKTVEAGGTVIAEPDFGGDWVGETFAANYTASSSFNLDLLDPVDAPFSFDAFYPSDVNPNPAIGFKDGHLRDIEVARGVGGFNYGRVTFVDATVDLTSTHEGTSTAILNQYLTLYTSNLWEGDQDSFFSNQLIGANRGEPNERPQIADYADLIKISDDFTANNLILSIESNPSQTIDVTAPPLTGWNADSNIFFRSDINQNEFGNVAFGPSGFGEVPNLAVQSFGAQSLSGNGLLPNAVTSLAASTSAPISFIFEGNLEVTLPIFAKDIKFIGYEDLLRGTDLSMVDIVSIGSALGLNQLGILPDNSELMVNDDRLGQVVFGSGGDDGFEGDDGSDIFIGNGGNDIFRVYTDLEDESDILVGGTGDDEYILDGFEYYFDKIIVSERLAPDEDAGGNDILRINANSTDVTVVDGNSPNDLRILVPHTGSFDFGIINVINQLGTDPDDWIEEIEFADGVTWTRTQLIAAAVAPDPISATALDAVTVAEDNAILFSVSDAFIDTYRRDFVYSATLANGDPLPEWLSIVDGNVTGTPLPNFNGQLDIAVTGTIGGESVTTNLSLTITPENDAPEIDNPLANVFLTEGDLVDIAVPLDTFLDVDGDALTLTATLVDGQPLPAWLSFDGTNFTGTPPAGFVGFLDLSVTASDGLLEATDSFVLVVEESGNGAPIVSLNLANQNSDEDQLVDILLPTDVFTDPDGDALTLTATLADGNDLPAWLSFDGQRFTGTPPQNFNGTLALAVTASDGQLEASQSFDLIIDPVNDAPILQSALLDQSSEANQAVSFMLPEGAFTDVDGDLLTLGAALTDGGALPAWLQFNGSSFAGMPPIDFVGDLELTVTASDGSLSVSDDFILTIEAPTPGTGIPYPVITNIVEYDGYYMEGTSANDEMFAISSSDGTNMVALGGDDLLISESWNSSLQGRDGVDVLVIRNLDARVYGDAEGDQYGNVTGPGNSQSADYFVFDVTDYVGPTWGLDPSEIWGTIKDYSDGNDKIAILNGSGGVNGFGDLTITQNGTSVDISTPTIPKIVLENTLLADIDASDFIFGTGMAGSTQSASAGYMAEQIEGGSPGSIDTVKLAALYRYGFSRRSMESSNRRNNRSADDSGLWFPVEGRLPEPGFSDSYIPELAALRVGLGNAHTRLTGQGLSFNVPAETNVFDYFEQPQMMAPQGGATVQSKISMVAATVTKGPVPSNEESMITPRESFGNNVLAGIFGVQDDKESGSLTIAAKNSIRSANENSPTERAAPERVVGMFASEYRGGPAKVDADMLKIALMTQDMSVFGMVSAAASSLERDRQFATLDYFAA